MTSFWFPLMLSLQIAVVSSCIVLFIALGVAWVMNRYSFFGKSFLETMWMLPMVLSPTIIGFLLLLLLGKHSWVGQLFEWLFQQPLLFTWWAAVIATCVVSFPIVYQIIKNGFESVDSTLEEAARSLGANHWQVFWQITLPLSQKSVLTAFILGFTRGLGEFGATLMVAGNIPGKTETVSTAIYIAVETGNYSFAFSLASIVAILSFMLLIIINKLKEA